MENHKAFKRFNMLLCLVSINRTYCTVGERSPTVARCHMYALFHEHWLWVSIQILPSCMPHSMPAAVSYSEIDKRKIHTGRSRPKESLVGGVIVISPTQILLQNTPLVALYVCTAEYHPVVVRRFVSVGTLRKVPYRMEDGVTAIRLNV